MALDDIVKYGRQGITAEGFRADYKSNNTLNPSLEVLRLEGVDRTDPESFAAAQQATPDFTPSRHQATLDDYINTNGGNATHEVQADVPGAFRLITKEEVMRSYIAQRKPVKYTGVNDELFEAHEGAHKAYALLNNKNALEQKAQEYVAERVKKLIDANINEAAVRLVHGIYAGNPNLANQAVQRDAIAKVNTFNEKFKEIGTARSYALARYNALSDADKANEAYEVAKAVAISAAA